MNSYGLLTLTLLGLGAGGQSKMLRAANFDIARPRSWWAASLPAANFDIDTRQ